MLLPVNHHTLAKQQEEGRSNNFFYVFKAVNLNRVPTKQYKFIDNQHYQVIKNDFLVYNLFKTDIFRIYILLSMFSLSGTFSDNVYRIEIIVSDKHLLRQLTSIYIAMIFKNLLIITLN